MTIMIGTTTDNETEARAIARACVQAGLAACAHIDRIESCYVWDGAVQEATEFRVFLKTVEAAQDRVFALIRAQHSYDEPAIFTIPITGGSDSYLRWIADNSTPKGSAP